MSPGRGVTGGECPHPPGLGPPLCVGSPRLLQQTARLVLPAVLGGGSPTRASLAQNQVSAGLVPAGSSRGNLFLSLFQLLEANPNPWHVAPSSTSPHPLCFPPRIRTDQVNPGPPPISSSITGQVPVSHKVMHSQVQGGGCGHLGELALWGLQGSGALGSAQQGWLIRPVGTAIRKMREVKSSPRT